MEKESEKKRACETVISCQLQEWEDWIYNLKARLERCNEATQAQYVKQVEDLRLQWEMLNQKAREWRRFGNRTWEEVKIGLEKGLDELKQSFTRAAVHL